MNNSEFVLKISISLKCNPAKKPFFLMCHHKAPHREWEPHPKYRELFTSDIKIPSTFDDDYKNRAKAAAANSFAIFVLFVCDCTFL